jgi:hypothetical protein
MFNSRMTLIAIMAVGSMAFTAALGQDNASPKDVEVDRGRYRQLLGEVRTLDFEYAKTLEQAVEETKKEGKASLESKSQLIGLGEKRDRCVNRLILVSLRHGWDIPDLNIQNMTAAKIVSEKERIFQSADNMIRDRFAQEAKQIAGKIALPIISLQGSAHKATK